MSDIDIKQVAKDYIDAGWAVVPLTAGEKRASTRWRTNVYNPGHFSAGDNIALKCGEPSGWRIDIDLDHPVAIEMAKLFLPPTSMIHGRPGKPDSHYWFLVVGAKSRVWKDVKDGNDRTQTLVELRSTGGYTAVPPSIHPSGDLLSWSMDRECTSYGEVVLVEAVMNVAIATLLTLHWPGAGARHSSVAAMTGFLLRYGMNPLMVEQVMIAAAKAANDPDLHDRTNVVKNTCSKFKADKDAVLTGGPTAAEGFGEDVVTRIRAWLGVADDDALEQMNAKHFFVTLGSKSVIGREDKPTGVVFQPVRELYPEYANVLIKVGAKENKKTGDITDIMKTVFEAWLASPKRRSYDNVIFAPPPQVTSDRDYNLWKGFAIEPDATGSCELFKAHLRDVICSGNLEHYEYLKKFCAHVFQFPGLPAEVAVVMRGGYGAGKGTVLRMLKRIFGERHFAHLSRSEELVKWNALVSGKVVVFADEAFFAGDKENVGALKRLITEPTLTISRKHLDSSEERNCIHLFMATNETWAIPAGIGERRFFAVEVASSREQDAAYFDALYKEINGAGPARFLYEMLQVSLTPGDLRDVPRTSELRRQQDQSLPLHFKWLQESLYEGRLGPIVWDSTVTWLPVSVPYDGYKMWVREHTSRFLDKLEFGRQIQKFLTAAKPQVRRMNNERVRAIHLLDLQTARELFDHHMRTTTDWPALDLTGTRDADIPF